MYIWVWNKEMLQNVLIVINIKLERRREMEGKYTSNNKSADNVLNVNVEKR